MRSLLANKQDYINFSIALVTMLCLGVFCYFAQFSLIIPLVLLFAGVHLAYFRKAEWRLFLYLGLLIALLFFTANAVVHYGSTPFYIPVASIAILTILLFSDLQLAFLMAAVSSIIVGLMTDGSLAMMLTFFAGSLVGMYSARGARTRAELINAGFFIFIIQLFCVVLLNPSQEFLLTRSFAIEYVRPLAVNGILCIGVVMFTLKIFETAFGVITNFSLLELSDFNHPLLKRMVIEAPGTYHHSLIVSNLAEAAADAIGANALLVRVGSYYHDIGKLNKPEYFTENQIVGGNKHDDLEPTMSKLVILNHVKDGIELAKKHKLNPVICRFIPQHHGTSLIYYFYQRALESADHDETVEEQTFRYPGPKPQTRETAIVLLADSVEGAVRALDEQTPARINDVVRKIINNKFIDGQLDECTLTLKDLEKIGEVFMRVLSAIYHSRIKYPDKKNENGNNNKKSSKKNASDNQPSDNNRAQDA